MKRPIERDFPFEEIDKLAELESWRKEINRPIYHIHKWWATRLGSVFRAILLGAFGDQQTGIWRDFYKRHDFSNRVVLDPFMGSGTTIGESLKLGIKAIGCDINPVSAFITRQSLTRIDGVELIKTFESIKSDVQAEISQYYKTRIIGVVDPVTVLYFFWVKIVITPHGEEIPLFSKWVFSKHAYPRKHPTVRILCPECWSVFSENYDSKTVVCPDCKVDFNPHEGPAKGQYVIDCNGEKWKIKELVAKTSAPPSHKLYATMALDPSGRKIYQAANDFDRSLYKRASMDLHRRQLPLPDMPIRTGYNTDQVRGYNYQNWCQFFNDRQLLCLGILLDRILKIPDLPLREQVLCLFSGTLEFNNMFCSFKGEGTGAVRHLFSHHILKPERTPLENSVWGTSKSSGTFSTLFKSRLLRAKNYLDEPFELMINETEGYPSSTKTVCSQPISCTLAEDFSEFSLNSRSALILAGDSSTLPIPDKSVDAVVTDPPYFDFVNYSELSDFFYAWLSPVLRDKYSYFRQEHSGRHGEVQNSDAKIFSENLSSVFHECRRVLKDDGSLIFTFHHSTYSGWMSLYEAVSTSGFELIAAHPIKAEMSGSTPKSATKNPINIDVILVSKKAGKRRRKRSGTWPNAIEQCVKYFKRFERVGRDLNLGDKRVILASQVVLESFKHGLESDAIFAMIEKAYSTDDFGS